MAFKKTKLAFRTLYNSAKYFDEKNLISGYIWKDSRHLS